MQRADYKLHVDLELHRGSVPQVVQESVVMYKGSCLYASSFKIHSFMF